MNASGTPIGGTQFLSSSGQEYGGLDGVIVLDDHTLLGKGHLTYSVDAYNVTFKMAPNGDPIPFTLETYDREHAVTSMFAVRGGAVISLADGTVLGPDEGFAQMHLSHAQPLGHGRYVGDPPNVLIGTLGPNLLTNPSTWSQSSGQRGAGAATPNCSDPDLNDLIASYPYTTSTGIALPIRPNCTDFTKDGQGSVHFSWGELNGHIIYDENGNRKPSENDYDWAMVKDILRTGLDLTYEAIDGIRLSSVYRTPDQNAKITGSGTSSAHMWGVGADMKPSELPWWPHVQTGLGRV